MDSKKTFSYSEKKRFLTSRCWFFPLAFVNFWPTERFKLLSLSRNTWIINIHATLINSWFLQMWKQFSCLPRRAAQPPSPSRRGSAGCLGTPGLFASPSRIQAPALLPLFSFWEQIKTIQFSPDRWHSFKLWPHCPYVSCAMYGLFHRILLAVSWWHIVPLFCSLALS